MRFYAITVPKLANYVIMLMVIIMKNINIREAAEQQRRLFGERLRTLRKDAGLTQQQLAQRSGFTVSVIARYEAGGSLPRPQAIEKLAAALGVSAADLDGSNNNADKIKLVNFFNSLKDPKDFKAEARLSGNDVIITEPNPAGVFETKFSFETFAKIMQKTEADTVAYLIPFRMLALRMYLHENILTAVMAEMEKDDPETAAKIKKIWASK